jgi:hypothetical protein
MICASIFSGTAGAIPSSMMTASSFIAVSMDASATKAASGSRRNRLLKRNLLCPQTCSAHPRQLLRALPSRAPRAFRRKKQTPFRASAKTPLLLTVSREDPFRLLPRSRRSQGLQQLLQPTTNEKGNQMPKRKNPTEPFRQTAVVSPVPSERRFAKGRPKKRAFDIYITDIETAEEMHAMTVFALSSREALQSARKKLLFSPLLRNVTHAVFSAVEADRDALARKEDKSK